MEYKLTQREFDQLSQLIYENSGISLHQGKRELVRARLSKRLREIGLRSFQAYYDYVVKEAGGRELMAMLDAISTNLTSFFRESAHFDFLRQELIPRLVARKGAASRRLWAWSAGCSSGEEPYSLALCILEAVPNLLGWDFKLLATDISTRALEVARRGVYSSERLAGVPGETLARYFQRGVGEWAGHYRIKAEVRRLVDFRRANLLEGPPVSGLFEIIFCRNVMIYFDSEVQERVIGLFREQLQPGGCLFIGHSESLAGVRHSLSYVRPAIYCKEAGAGGRQRLSH